MADTVNILVIAIGILLVAAYIGVYLTYRQYLREPFESKPQELATPQEPISSVVTDFVARDIQPDPQPSQNASEGEIKFTFGNPIQSVDDYEYNLIFKNESDREITKALRNKLMSQYPMHFSVLPPSAPEFVANTTEGFEDQGTQTAVDTLKKQMDQLRSDQAKREAQLQESIDIHKEAAQLLSDATRGSSNPYSAISNTSVAPPDTLTAEQQERSLLKPYTPKKAGDLTTYNVEDAMEVIKKIYDKKGEIADVKKREDNVYEIVGSRKKNEKIVYEDTDTDSPPISTNADIKVPSVVNDMSAERDPFYEMKDRNTKQDRWDYRQWTPGLERMFAPTEPRANWY
jgi:hypothetical protein